MSDLGNKEILAKNLTRLMDSKGINAQRLAEELEYPYTTVLSWANGVNYPRIDKIEEMSQFFGVLKSDLIEDKANETDLSKFGIQTLQKAKRIPILGEIACGDPIWAIENYDGYFIVDDTIKADFCLKAKGDSMIDASIFEGDTVFLKKTPVVENGQIAAVLIDDSATLKRVYRTDQGILLQPCNNAYQPIIVSDDVMIIGEVVGVYHPVKF